MSTGQEIRWACAVSLLLLAGCARQELSTARTDNPNFTPDRLFTQDGCTVYRFLDAGRYHYFATCPGSSLSHHYSCGKGCSREESFPTVESDR